ncbi:MAG: LysM peptidoglycan-binding domain-containing protein [Thermoleophilia bacterium]
MSAARNGGAASSGGSTRPRAIAVRGASRRPLSRAGRRERRRRRFAGFLRLAVFLLLILVAVWAGARVAHAGGDAALYTGQRYVVQAGDSLWSIAEGEYGDGIDLRSAVFEIRAASGLGGSAVQPGDALTLPYLGD